MRVLPWGLFMTPNRYLPLEVPEGPAAATSIHNNSGPPKDLRTCVVRLLMRQTACARRFLAAMIGGGTWEGAPMPGMRRRDFVALVGGVAVPWPLAVRAQQPVMPVIGFAHPLSPYNASRWLTALRKGLHETGYVEGQNVAIEYRWAEGQYDRLPALMADLVEHQVAVIVAAGGEPSPQAAMAATQTIPIVFTASVDPVSSGLVASLSRPGGNVTGVTIFGSEAIAKRVEMLRELVPKAASIAYLINPMHPNAESEWRDAQTAAHFQDSKFW